MLITKILKPDKFTAAEIARLGTLNFDYMPVRMQQAAIDKAEEMLATFVAAGVTGVDYLCRAAMENKMTIHDHLELIGACLSAREWADQFNTAQEVWDNNTNIAWLFWWSARLGNLSGVREAAKEITDSVSDLKNTYAASAVAIYAIHAAAAADADANAAADAASAVATDAANAAASAIYATHAAAIYAANAVAIKAAFEAHDKQVKLNMQIAKKHCPLPWKEAE